MKNRLQCVTANARGVGLVFALTGLFFGPVAALGEPVDFKTISLSRTQYVAAFASCRVAPATPRYVAIRSWEEWADRCNPLNPQSAAMTPHAKPDRPRDQSRQEPVSDFDFDHYTLLVADAGPRPNTENFLVFTGVRDQGNAIVVDVMEVTAGQDCVSLSTVNPDLHAYALIPRTDKTIHFWISKAVRDCSTQKLVN